MAAKSGSAAAASSSSTKIAPLIPGPLRSRMPGFNAIVPKRLRPNPIPSTLTPDQIEAAAEQSELANFLDLHRRFSTVPLMAGTMVQFGLVPKDSVLEQGIAHDKWNIQIVPTFGASPKPLEQDLFRDASGTTNVRFTPTIAGTYTITIHVPKIARTARGGQAAPAPPTILPITVHAGRIDPKATRLIFEGNQARNFGIASVAGRVGFFLISSVDAYGNIAPLAKGNETFQAICKDTAFKILRIEPVGLGQYKVTYYTERATSFAVRVLLCSAVKHSVVELAESPVHISVLPDVPSKDHCQFQPMAEYHAGELGSYTVGVFDRFGNPLTAAKLVRKTDTKCLEYREIHNLSTIPHDPKPGFYRIEFYTEKCYKYIFKTLVEGNEGIDFDDMFELPVYILTPLPGQLTVAHCFDADRRQFCGKAGVKGTLTVHKRDRFNNRINADIFNRTESDAVFAIKCDDESLKLFPAETADGSMFTISYMATKSGTYMLWLWLGDQKLEGGPFSLVIEPGPPDASQSFFECPLPPALSMAPSNVSVWLQDKYGNETSVEDPAKQPAITIAGEKAEKGTAGVTYAEPYRYQPLGEEVPVITSNAPIVPRPLPELLNNTDVAAGATVSAPASVPASARNNPTSADANLNSSPSPTPKHHPIPTTTSTMSTGSALAASGGRPASPISPVLDFTTMEAQSEGGSINLLAIDSARRGSTEEASMEVTNHLSWVQFAIPKAFVVEPSAEPPAAAAPGSPTEPGSPTKPTKAGMPTMSSVSKPSAPPPPPPPVPLAPFGGFIKVRAFARCKPQEASMWAVEYSDNGVAWTQAAKLLVTSGWVETSWSHCGTHPLWRLSSPLHEPMKIELPVGEGSGRGAVVIPNKRSSDVLIRPNRSSQWLSVEWYCAEFGKAFSAFTRQRTRVYDVTMKIGEETAACCGGGTVFPLWVNNITFPPKCAVELPGPAEELMVRETMSLTIILKDKLGFQRLVGSEADEQSLNIKIENPYSNAVPFELVNNGNGTYTVKFDGKIAGWYKVDFRYMNQPIPCFEGFTLLPSATKADHCLCVPINPTFEELKRMEAKMHDAAIRQAAHESETLSSPIEEPIDLGLHELKFARHGTALLRSRGSMDPVGLAGQPPGTARSTSGGGGGGGGGLIASDIENSTHDLDKNFLDGLVGGDVGRPSRFRILARDGFFNHCRNGKDDFEVTISGLSFPNGFTQPFIPITASVIYEGRGFYGVSYTLTRSGRYLIDVRLKLSELQIQQMVPPPTPEQCTIPIATYEVEMWCGPVAPPQCTLMANTHKQGKPISAGESVSLVFSIRDKFGNPLSTDLSSMSCWFYTPWEKAADEARAQRELEEKERREAAEAAAKAAAEAEQAAALQATLSITTTRGGVTPHSRGGAQASPAGAPPSPNALNTSTSNLDKSKSGVMDAAADGGEGGEPLQPQVDPTNVFDPVLHPPQHSIAEAPQQGVGVYTISFSAFTMGSYILHLAFKGTEVFAYPFVVTPTAPVAANCKILSLSPDLTKCIECDNLTAMYFCRVCNQRFCEPCWVAYHDRKTPPPPTIAPTPPPTAGGNSPLMSIYGVRGHHPRTVVGIDDIRHKLVDPMSFGLLTRDAYDNNVVIPETSHVAFEVVLEFREYIKEIKPGKDAKGAKGKKPAAPIPIQITILDGAALDFEVLPTDSVISLKRRLIEKELPTTSIPLLHLQKLISNGKLMEDVKMLSDYQLQKGSVLTLELNEELANNFFDAEVANLGKGVWKADFALRGYGQYVVQLKIGNSAPVKDLHQFVLDTPVEEPKGKAAVTKFVDDLKREILDLKVKLGICAAPPPETTPRKSRTPDTGHRASMLMADGAGSTSGDEDTHSVSASAAAASVSEGGGGGGGGAGEDGAASAPAAVSQTPESSGPPVPGDAAETGKVEEGGRREEGGTAAAPTAEGAAAPTSSSGEPEAQERRAEEPTSSSSSTAPPTDDVASASAPSPPPPPPGPPMYLRLTVVSGAKLIPQDLRTSDPFVEILLDGKATGAKTATKDSTLDPTWNQELYLEVPTTVAKVQLCVWDYDRLSKNDFMGQAELDPINRTDGPMTLALGPRPGHADDQKLWAKFKESFGSLSVVVAWLPTNDGIPTTATVFKAQ